jgi:CRP-like cAMP-binding protein
MVIGIASAFSGSRYKETVRAFEDLEVIPIKKDEFVTHVLHDQALSYYFLEQMATFQLQADEKLLLQAFGTVRKKLAATLIDLGTAYNKGEKNDYSCIREDLASMAGTAKETIIRCLSEFKEKDSSPFKEVISAYPRCKNYQNSVTKFY